MEESIMWVGIDAHLTNGMSNSLTVEWDRTCSRSLA